MYKMHRRNEALTMEVISEGKDKEKTKCENVKQGYKRHAGSREEDDQKAI
jgi:hypothetical protein